VFWWQICYHIHVACRVILDTNVLVSACLGSGPANQVVRACLLGLCRPLIGVALFAEYEDVMGRGDLWVRSPLTAQERQHLFDIFLGHCEWTRVYFGWRPNLPDEADNHLIELALAGGASFIVSRNLRDLVRGELQFPGLRALDPASFLEELSRWPH
jgi:predicted nucleic acid-binding protein